MSAIDDLLDGIFDGKQPALYDEFADWVRGSRRFKAFAATYHSKIRAKLRSARDEAGMNDLRAELEAAALLLRDERVALEYEKYTAARQRGPDYTVTFRTHTPFNVEVRRVRGAELNGASAELNGASAELNGASAELGGDDADTRTNKLMSVLCDKAGQMPPSIVNLLWLTADGALAEADLSNAAATLRQLAERKAEDFFTRRGFAGTAEFLRQYRQLSGVVLHQPGANVIWLNALARHKTPPEIVTAIERL